MGRIIASYDTDMQGQTSYSYDLILALVMVYHPTKAQLDGEIPRVFRDINHVVKQFKEKTGADDRYVSMIFGALMAEYTRKSRGAASAFR